MSGRTKAAIRRHLPSNRYVHDHRFSVTSGPGHLITGGTLTRWGLVNALTRTAEDVDTYDRATDFERFGGQVIELPRRDWERIALAA